MLTNVVKRITIKLLSSGSNKITAKLLSNKDVDHHYFQILIFHYKVFSG